MRRLLIVLLSIIVLSALMSSAALAKAKLLPDPPAITSIEWTASGPGTASGTCKTSITTTYVNAPGGASLKFFLYDQGAFEQVATAKTNRNGVTTITFDRAYTAQDLYLVRVVMVKKNDFLAAQLTSPWRWAHEVGCPAIGVILGSYPAP
jgi:hypothetical protein